MTFIAVSDNCVVVAKGLSIDYYDFMNHNYINVPKHPKALENDHISDITISSNAKYLGLITSASKQLLVYILPLNNSATYHKNFILPRSASRIRFTTNNEQVLVADKSGDVLIFNIKQDEPVIKLLGHLSLLLDVLQTENEKYVITSDRDEKIRVSCYPNTYNIQTFCLGHKEFVNHIEILPHDINYLTSASGDGTIKCWDYVEGKLCYSIDTSDDIDQEQLKMTFCKIMDEEGVEVTTLPIVHYTITCISDCCSLLAVLVHTYKFLLIYNLQSVNKKLTHTLVEKLPMDNFPAAVKFYKLFLYVYDDVDCNIRMYKIIKDCKNVALNLEKKISVFEDKKDMEFQESFDFIKVLYKRKFDNVQEYQERKRQRLEKSSK